MSNYELPSKIKTIDQRKAKKKKGQQNENIPIYQKLTLTLVKVAQSYKQVNKLKQERKLQIKNSKVEDMSRIKMLNWVGKEREYSKYLKETQRCTEKWREFLNSRYESEPSNPSLDSMHLTLRRLQKTRKA